MRDQARERGQGTIEYALLIVLIGIVAVAALSLLGQNLYTVFYGIAEALQFKCGRVGEETFLSYVGEGGEAPSGGLTLLSPARGTITQRYWFCHKGLDIAAPAGTPVRAVAAGTVKFAGWSDEGYGNLVVIDHGSYQSLYAHLRDRPSLAGSVGAGALIGPMGSTGFSTGPHLHFEIRLGSELVDPVSLLW